MYEAKYGLKDLPFQPSPDHRFFYPSRGHKQAMAYLTYGLNLRDGFIEHHRQNAAGGRRTKQAG